MAQFAKFSYGVSSLLNKNTQRLNKPFGDPLTTLGLRSASSHCGAFTLPADAHWCSSQLVYC